MKRPVKLLSLFLIALFAVYLTASQAQNLLSNDEPENREVVVLLHGLARSSAAMWLLHLRLHRAGYHVESVGYSSMSQTPEEIVADISQQIDTCCKSHDNKIHFVGHSLGGLLIRAYLQEKRPQNMGRVVLIGTPNHGTAMADYFRDKWWAGVAGPTALALGTDETSFPRSLPDPDYPVGIIAGIGEGQMNDHILPGADDGLVSVESTKLNGMRDFVVVNASHSMMRYDDAVAMQTIHFLQTGAFERASGSDRPEQNK